MQAAQPHCVQLLYPQWSQAQWWMHSDVQQPYDLVLYQWDSFLSRKWLMYFRLKDFPVLQTGLHLASCDVDDVVLGIEPQPVSKWTPSAFWRVQVHGRRFWFKGGVWNWRLIRGYTTLQAINVFSKVFVAASMIANCLLNLNLHKQDSLEFDYRHHPASRLKNLGLYWVV